MPPPPSPLSPATMEVDGCPQAEGVCYCCSWVKQEPERELLREKDWRDERSNLNPNPLPIPLKIPQPNTLAKKRGWCEREERMGMFNGMRLREVI